jgi:hypothetical protein
MGPAPPAAARPCGTQLPRADLNGAQRSLGRRGQHWLLLTLQATAWAPSPLGRRPHWPRRSSASASVGPGPNGAPAHPLRPRSKASRCDRSVPAAWRALLLPHWAQPAHPRRPTPRAFRPGRNRPTAAGLESACRQCRRIDPLPPTTERGWRARRFIRWMEARGEWGQALASHPAPSSARDSRHSGTGAAAPGTAHPSGWDAQLARAPPLGCPGRSQPPAAEGRARGSRRPPPQPGLEPTPVAGHAPAFRILGRCAVRPIQTGQPRAREPLPRDRLRLARPGQGPLRRCGPGMEECLLSVSGRGPRDNSAASSPAPVGPIRRAPSIGPQRPDSAIPC